MQTEIYGVAYHSPIILWQLVHPKKYNVILLVNNQPSQIKEDVQSQLRKDARTPVVLAGSLDIVHSLLKLFPKLDCKLILFDCPGLINPFVGPKMRWLDCDHQAGGAWQIAKIKPEDFSELLDQLSVLTPEGREFINSMKRQGSDRLEDIKKFADSIPKYYKDLLASMEAETNKSPIKTLKESRRSRDNLRSLLGGILVQVENKEDKLKLLQLVLDYQVALVGKREYLSKLTLLVTDELLKKEFLALRKWIDSKSGSLLQEAYFDYVANSERRSWQTIVDTYKKISEEDLQMLISHLSPVEALLSLKEKISIYENLPSDKSKTINRPDAVNLVEVFGL